MYTVLIFTFILTFIFTLIFIFLFIFILVFIFILMFILIFILILWFDDRIMTFCVSNRDMKLTWPAASLHRRTAPTDPWAPPTRPYMAPRRWSLDQSDRWRCGGWCCGQAAWGWGAVAAEKSGPYLQNRKIKTQRNLFRCFHSNSNTFQIFSIKIFLI